MLRACLLTMLLFVGVSSLCDVARAQAGDPSGYDTAIDQALAAFDRGDFATARELFLRAHKILPSARTLRALGKAEYELKRYDEAATHLALALDSDVRRLTDEQRSETSALLRKSEEFLATYTLQLTPPNADLRLDGATIALDADSSVRLIAGAHVLEASAPEYMRWRRELLVQARVDTVLSVQLTPLAKTPPMQAEHVDAPRDDAPPRKRRWLLWTSLGVLVAAGAITGVLIALKEPEPARASGGNSGLVWTLGR
jgi:tetratricopeptide (TPR) repeat protein